METKMNELDMLCTIAKTYSSVTPKVTDPIKQGTLFVKKFSSPSNTAAFYLKIAMYFNCL